MKISPVFYALLAFELLTLGFYFFGSEDSGAGVFAVGIAVLFPVAAVYNKWKCGTWFTDSSGGN